MQPKKLLTWISAIGLMAATATPALAQTNWFWQNGAAPDFSYQSPDGSYPSYTDYSRALWGMPCGIMCTRAAAKRWGLVPLRRQPPPPYHYRYGY